MHASRLVDLAALVVGQHSLLCQQNVNPEYLAADQFWVLSRARLNEWARKLKSCESIRIHNTDFDALKFWIQTRPVIEEVLLSEVCTRVWCATLSILEQQWKPGELDPIARSVFISNLEARRRALRLILLAKGLSGISTTTVNALRMQCETWTDYLLADLSSLSLAQQYCFDRSRLKLAFNARQQARTSSQSQKIRQNARLMALRYFLSTRTFMPAVCEELNSEVAAIILSSMPPTAFDGTGVQNLDFSLTCPSPDSASLDILADLYGTSGSTRYDARRGLKDRH